MVRENRTGEKMTVQEFIDILQKVEDKSMYVYLDAFPEWDNCSDTIPLIKSKVRVIERRSFLPCPALVINGEIYKRD